MDSLCLCNSIDSFNSEVQNRDISRSFTKYHNIIKTAVDFLVKTVYGSFYLPSTGGECTMTSVCDH